MMVMVSPGVLPIAGPGPLSGFGEIAQQNSVPGFSGFAEWVSGVRPCEDDEHTDIGAHSEKTSNMTSAIPATTAVRLCRRVRRVSVVSGPAVSGGIPGGDHE
jgi:hypothetical protein